MIRQSHSGSTVSAGADWPDQTAYYRALLRSLRSPRGPSNDVPGLIGVTSCSRGEGVSTVAMNLVRQTTRDSDERALLIDLSLTQESATGLLEGEATNGLSDMLLQGTRPSECIYQVCLPEMPDDRTAAVLGMGSLADELRSTFDREQLGKLFHGLKVIYPFIVVDLPTANRLSGCYELASILDGLLLVVQAEKVRTQVAQQVRDQLLEVDGNLLGVVFNKRPQHVPDWLYART